MPSFTEWLDRGEAVLPDGRQPSDLAGLQQLPDNRRVLDPFWVLRSVFPPK